MKRFAWTCCIAAQTSVTAIGIASLPPLRTRLITCN